MAITFTTHALDRMSERGATRSDVEAAVSSGEVLPAQFGRTTFRRNLPFDSTWRGKTYATKQIEAVCVRELDDWVVVTVLVKYF